MLSATPNRRSVILGALAGTTALSAGPLLAQDAPAREVLEMAEGAEDAPVTVIEYASFTCPHCRSFHEEVYPKIKTDFIETGKVRFIMREVYFDRYGLWAGMVARCAGPDRYFGVIDLIFKNQDTWPRAEDPSVVVQNLFAIGRQAGMTNETMDECVQDGDWAQALVDRYQETATEHEITGTPSFVINGQKYSNMGYAQFAEVLNEKLES